MMVKSLNPTIDRSPLPLLNLSFSSSAIAVVMGQSQSKIVTLDDNEVSRMMAELAMHDAVFKKQLLDCVKPDFFDWYTKYKSKQFGDVCKSIPNFRQQLVDQAGLRIPDLASGVRQDLNTYLKKVTNARVLVSAANKEKVVKSRTKYMKGDGQWGWVVRLPECLEALPSHI